MYELIKYHYSSFLFMYLGDIKSFRLLVLKSFAINRKKTTSPYVENQLILVVSKAKKAIKVITLRVLFLFL